MSRMGYTLVSVQLAALQSYYLIFNVYSLPSLTKSPGIMWFHTVIATKQ